MWGGSAKRRANWFSCRLMEPIFVETRFLRLFSFYFEFSRQTVPTISWNLCQYFIVTICRLLKINLLNLLNKLNWSLNLHNLHMQKKYQWYASHIGSRMVSVHFDSLISFLPKITSMFGDEISRSDVKRCNYFLPLNRVQKSEYFQPFNIGMIIYIKISPSKVYQD